MEKIPTTQSKHINWGFFVTLGSALFLSTTAIFIRHLTRGYMLRLGDAWAGWLVLAAVQKASGTMLLGAVAVLRFGRE